MPDIGLIWGNLILNPMINIMLIIYNFLFHNFGIAIILLTALIRLITMPLTLKQQRSMEKMQELQRSKKWTDIEKKHKGDRTKIQQEQFKLSREVGVSPFGGCLPLLLQFPIIIGLYQSITRALATVPAQLLELSKHIYPFVPATLIPLNSQFLWWDMALPERVTAPVVLGISIPLLTILVVITSYLQTKLTTPPTTDAQSRQMSTMMTLYMPFLLGFFAYSYASGLALYFLTTNVMTIGQYAALGKVNWRAALSLRGSS
ncbi:MAG TPA: YidC/Oxa1 family membrane protein insertase [Anaerolineales bacterium]|nr:YidC/Oxa1 family membrane protein insertase [Anaerolineales bacterium]